MLAAMRALRIFSLVAKACKSSKISMSDIASAFKSALLKSSFEILFHINFVLAVICDIVRNDFKRQIPIKSVLIDDKCYVVDYRIR